MKRIGIYCFTFSKEFVWDEESYINGTIGNSETWAIKLSEELSKKGNDVYVFANPNQEHVSKNGVHFLKNENFEKYCNEQAFDYIILSRTVEALKYVKNCKNVYLMCHDAEIIGYYNDFINGVKKVMYKSDFQREILKLKYGIPDNKLYKTFEGIDQALYDKYDGIEKTNKMLISGEFGGGIRWLIENVFHKIKKEIPDFELHIIDYNNIGSQLYNQDGIFVHGNLNIEDYVKMQCSSKIWIYPSHGYDSEFNRNNETFGICSVENAYAKNACILGKWGCFASTLEGYNGFVGNNLFSNIMEPMEYDNVEKFADALVNDAIKCLKDEDYRQSLVKQTYEIAKKYTWDNAVSTFLEMFSDSEKSVMVYVIAHKDFPYLIRDDIHTVLQVGSAINGDLGIGICDNTGDNISEKNKFFLDTTGVYWVCKNSPRYDYIGAQSYRRDFGLSKSEIVDILKTHDVIASPFFVPNSLYEQYKACHIIKDLEECEKIISDLYPEYGDKFGHFIRETNKLYIGCGCIAPYEKYNEINSFVFGVLFELEKRYGFKTYEEWVEYAEKSGQNLMPEDHKKSGLSAAEYQARLFGALYERIFTFYVCENYKNIYEKEYVRLDKEYERMNTKVLLCCIGRLENQYIREYVEYYKSIGFTNICLYDNNRDGEDDFREVIGDYIDNGYVILKNYRNITTPCQFKAYDECYAEYGDKYDWIAFFDIDEFLFMNQENNVSNLLSNKRYDGYKMIHFNWLMFGDCDMVYNDGRPMRVRFTKPLDVNLMCDYDFPETFHIKSVIRGGLGKITFGPTPHTVSDIDNCCNSYGIPCDPKSPFTPYDFRVGGLLHFSTKTAEEYANKVNRGFCDGNFGSKQSLIELFFKRNKVTKEKVELFKEKTGIDVSYLLPYSGEKNKDVKIFSLCYRRKDFKFLDDAVVTPLQVGASNNQSVCDLKDNTGDNISNENYFFVESTGTYWIWKNVKDSKYKGQMQYRRPLEGVDCTMNFDDIFGKYDVITCKPFNHPENSKPTKEQPMCIPAQTVEEGYRFSNCIDDLYILELAIKRYHPDYAEDYDKYIKKGENLYYSNGFVMRSEDFDRYSEFLFDCLGHYLELAKINNFEELLDHVKYNIETGKYIRYEKEPITDGAIKWQTEIGGFLSERVWTLWLQHNFSHDKIYELPYIKMEENMYT